MTAVAPPTQARQEFTAHFLALREFYSQGEVVYNPANTAVSNFLSATNNSIAAGYTVWLEGFKLASALQNTLSAFITRKCTKPMNFTRWVTRTSRFEDLASVSRQIILFQDEFIDVVRTLNLDDLVDYSRVSPQRLCEQILYSVTRATTRNSIANTRFCERPFFYRMRQLILLGERCHFNPNEETNKHETDKLLVLLDNIYSNNKNNNSEYYTTFFPPVTAPDLNSIFLTASVEHRSPSIQIFS